MYLLQKKGIIGDIHNMADDSERIELTPDEREELISKLVGELPVLRTRLELSQTELATLIDVSRQTYSAIETRRRKMSWGTFLSLILIFDNNARTHDIIRREGLFPQNIIQDMDSDLMVEDISSFVNIDGKTLKDNLDEQAMHTIESVIMIEYARCNNISGDAVIKAFNGRRFDQVEDKDVRAKRALDKIKSRSKKDEGNGSIGAGK